MKRVLSPRPQINFRLLVISAIVLFSAFSVVRSVVHRRSGLIIRTIRAEPGVLEISPVSWKYLLFVENRWCLRREVGE